MKAKSNHTLLLAMALILSGCAGDPAAINLHSAIMRGDLASVTKQIESGVSVELTDSKGRTPLYVAALYQQPDIIRYLMARDADHTRGVSWKSNRLPLHAAAQVGNIEIMDIFLAAGLDVNVRDMAERTPLHDAAQSTKPHAVEFLLTRGANANIRSKTGYSPLVLSFPDKIPPEQFAEYRQVLEHLLNHGADVNTLNGTRGITPLIYSAFIGDVDTVRYLLGKGADPTITSGIGEDGTALGVALHEGHQHIVTALQEHMTKEDAQQKPAPYFK